MLHVQDETFILQDVIWSGRISISAKRSTRMIDRSVRVDIDAPQTTRPDRRPAPVPPAAEQPAAPVIIPTVPTRPVASAVAQPVPAVPSVPEQFWQSSVDSPALSFDRKPRLPSPKAGPSEECRSPVVTPERQLEVPSAHPWPRLDSEIMDYTKDEAPRVPDRQREASPAQQQPRLNREPTETAVDGSDGEDDIEMPVLDPASPTDSEVESDRPCM